LGSNPTFEVTGKKEDKNFIRKPQFYEM